MNPQVKPGKLNELWLKITATGNMYSVVSKTCRYNFENLASTAQNVKKQNKGKTCQVIPQITTAS